MILVPKKGALDPATNLSSDEGIRSNFTRPQNHCMADLSRYAPGWTMSNVQFGVEGWDPIWGILMNPWWLWRIIATWPHPTWRFGGTQKDLNLGNIEVCCIIVHLTWCAPLTQDASHHPDYSSSHNHGSVENRVLEDVLLVCLQMDLFSSIFHWTMIMGGRVILLIGVITPFITGGPTRTPGKY